MSFLTRLSAREPYDTIAGMERAAEERFWDGLALAVDADSRRTGAVYLLGYVAEMLLKTAYFRLLGIHAAVDLASELRIVRSAALWTGGHNLHNVQAWADLLIDTRGLQGRPLSPIQIRDIGYHAGMVQSHWQEILRYRYTNAEEDELREIYTSVAWLRENHAWFWR